MGELVVIEFVTLDGVAQAPGEPACRATATFAIEADDLRRLAGDE